MVQGITEFLPISSSAHLALVPALTGWPDQGLVIDVAVHVGTLLAVTLYFWRDLLDMTAGVWSAARGRRNPNARLAGYLTIASLPVAMAGYLVNEYLGDGLRNITVIAWATLGFGLLLWVADSVGAAFRRIEHLSVADALAIGFAQALALIPGASRSGVTITAARALGVERPAAARFSMLLSIPAIIGAGGLKGWELYESGNAAMGVDATLAAGMAFVTALAAITLMMAWLRRSTFTPFVIYRILLGGGLLVLAYSGVWRI